ncbi:MAG: hypothetical protein ACRDHF_18835, partial [Tepidiformaceae bacterium]
PPPTPTPTVTATPTAPPVGSWTASAKTSRSSVRRGQTQVVTATVTSPSTGNALVDIEIYNPQGVKVHQAYFDNQPLSAGVPRSFSTSWKVPAGSAKGTYTVKIGVFAPGWGTMYLWNDSARTFVVR